MLNKETKDRLKELGLDAEAFEAAVKSDTEVEFKVPEGTLFTPETLEARDKNKFDEGKKNGFDTGKKAGIEISNKQVIEKFGLSDAKKEDDPANIAKFAFEISQKGDEGLKAQTQALLKDKQELEQKIAKRELDFESVLFEKELFASQPEKRRKDISDQDKLQLVKGCFKKNESGQWVAEYEGKILLDDKTKSPLGTKDALHKIYELKNFLEPETGGRGGLDGIQKTGSPKTLSGLQQEWTESGKSILSDEFYAEVQKYSKDSTFDIDK